MADKLISYEDAIEVIKDAKIAADIATSTMNDLLMFDKISTSKFEIFTKIARGWAFVVTSVKPFRTQARVTNLSLSCEIDDRAHKDATLLIDTPKMEQVVRNFLTNAIKFTPAGGALAVKVSIHSGFSCGNPADRSVGDLGVMRVSLRDSGPGISKVSQH